MSSRLKENFNSFRLEYFERVKTASRRAAPSVVNQYCADVFLKFDFALLSMVDSNCVDRKCFKKSIFSVSHLLYDTKQLRRMECTGLATMAVLPSYVAEFSKKYLSNACKIGRCTVMVITSVHVFVVIFHVVLLHCVVSTVEIWLNHGIALPGMVYRRIVCKTRNQIALGLRKADLFFQNFYNV